jgi:hypothetical protein
MASRPLLPPALAIPGFSLGLHHSSQSAHNPFMPTSTSMTSLHSASSVASLAAVAAFGNHTVSSELNSVNTIRPTPIFHTGSPLHLS